mgnify:CR=1 FL=1
MGNKEQEAIPLPDEVQKELESVRAAASADFQAAPDTQALEAARVAHLGMKGAVTKLFDRIPSLPKEQRRLFGQQANALRAELERALEERQKGLEHEALFMQAFGRRHEVADGLRRFVLLDGTVPPSDDCDLHGGEVGGQGIKEVG